MSRVYLDSCIVIYLIQGREELSRAILAELKPMDRKPPVAYVSDLTRLESRIWPLRQGNRGLLQQFDEFFMSDGLQILHFDTRIFDQATELRATHRTKTPDALHLAAAIVAGCDEFWTNDARLRSAARDKIALRFFS